MTFSVVLRLQSNKDLPANYSSSCCCHGAASLMTPKRVPTVQLCVSSERDRESESTTWSLMKHTKRLFELEATSLRISGVLERTVRTR